MLSAVTTAQPPVNRVTHLMVADLAVVRGM